MALAHSDEIWGSQLAGVRKDLFGLANAISELEPVKMLVLESDWNKAKAKVSAKVELVKAIFDDLWIRDYGPQFLMNPSKRLGAMDLKFNGWGDKQTHDNDRKIAKFIADRLGLELSESEVVMEGGALEFDGHRQLIATKSCIVNPNRNPELSFEAIDSKLKGQFGLDKIIWLPGIAGRDITDGHTDFYARFAPNGQVLFCKDNDEESFDFKVTNAHEIILDHEIENGRERTIALFPPEKLPKSADPTHFAAGYLNFYTVNGAVILPKFGDQQADELAQKLVGQAHPGRQVVSLSINSIAAGGGGIHCATLHQPKVT